MNIETMIYLADIIPKFESLCFVGFILIALSITFFFLSIGIGDEVIYNKMKKISKIFIPLGVIILLISMLAPSEKTIYLMIGANYLKTSTLPSKVELAIEKKIDEYLKDDTK